MRIALAALAIIATSIAAPAVAEAASRGTVRASGDVPLRDGPGARYDIIGKLPNGTRVHLERCTRNSNWCLAVLDGEPIGWARGSYLVGSGTKLEVTPQEFLGFNPLDPIPTFGRHRHRDDD
jgi:uncharacterized protein YraI